MIVYRARPFISTASTCIRLFDIRKLNSKTSEQILGMNTYQLLKLVDHDSEAWSEVRITLSAIVHLLATIELIDYLPTLT